MKTNAIFLLLALMTATGCADPVVGSWENKENNSSFSESLSIEGDGTGQRMHELHFVVGSGPLQGAGVDVKLEFDIDWEESRDHEYDVEVDCADASVKIAGEPFATGCRDVASFMDWRLENIEVECTVNKDGDELRCQPEGTDVKIKYERVD